MLADTELGTLTDTAHGTLAVEGPNMQAEGLAIVEPSTLVVNPAALPAA